MKIWQKIKTYGEMIKFSHTIFALPFAFAAVILANREKPITFWMLFWILIAMASARSAAMGFNRLADHKFDTLNPRTANRALPRGIISRKSTIMFVAVSSFLFILSAAALNELCFYLSFPVLLVLFGYSYTKRFTQWSHLFLGFSIGLAPLGAWLAVTGTFSWKILLLSVALMTYIAGFDILYSCQDIDFDRKTGLFSLPANKGPNFALRVSCLLHFLTFFSLATLYIIFQLKGIYLVFLAAIGILLVIEHILVNPRDFSKVNIAFFHVNSIISILILGAILADEILRRI
ncbi:MAG: 4-hydroxybenzoate octaprenyltransferase [Deltaproteobacteria bacterium]|nr:MAG: 4-hydroxybenzoate octaprenyltransferase [Deltaproteobacteria bacterium]